MNWLSTIVLLILCALTVLADNCDSDLRVDPQNHFTSPKPLCSSNPDGEISIYNVGDTFKVTWTTSRVRTNLELWQNENGWHNHNRSILVQTLTFNYSDTSYDYHVLSPPVMSPNTTFVFVLSNTNNRQKDLAVSDFFQINDGSFQSAINTTSTSSSKHSISVGVGVSFGLFLPIIIAIGIITYKIRLRKLKSLQAEPLKDRHISWPLPTSPPKRSPSKPDLRYVALRSHPPYQKALSLNPPVELPSHRFSRLRFQLTEFELAGRHERDSLPTLPELSGLTAGVMNHRI